MDNDRPRGGDDFAPRLDRRDDPSSETSHQRSAGLAIGLGALVVLALMLLVASGATRALWP